jgi:hypothetical protein
MTYKNFYYAPEGVVSSITIEKESGAEVEVGLAVDLYGHVGTNAKGVVINSRDKAQTVAMLGVVPVKVLDGVNIAVGQAVSSNTNGLAIPSAPAADIIGYALDAVTGADGDYIRVFLNPQPFIPAS